MDCILEHADQQSQVTNLFKAPLITSINISVIATQAVACATQPASTGNQLASPTTNPPNTDHIDLSPNKTQHFLLFEDNLLAIDWGFETIKIETVNH